jgi:cellulose synthase/poly-beta-1,6-N-acetylglucosamine synthase-like glycosyltransferase
MVSSVRVSILIPTFNEESLIGDVLQKAKQQRTNFPYEIVVVDGGSTDRTRRIAKALNVPVLLSTQKGKVAQINYAAQQAKGEIFCLVDADTLLPSNYVARIHRFFTRHPQVVACGARYKYFGRRVRRWRLGSRLFTLTSYEPLSLMMAMWYLLRDLFNYPELPGCNMCVRREAFFAVGGLPSVPRNLGIDAAFSYELLRLIRKQGWGRIRFLLSPAVLTAGRHLSMERSTQRLKQIQRYLDHKGSSEE